MSTMTLDRALEILKKNAEGTGSAIYQDAEACGVAYAALTSREAKGEASYADDPTFPTDDRTMLVFLNREFDSTSSVCACCGREEDVRTMDAASMLRDYLAAHPAAQEAAKPVEQAMGDHAVFEDANTRDAWRYRRLRAAPVGVPGVPCIAVPASATSGEYVNAEQADAAVDEAEMPENDVVVAYIETTPNGSQGLVWADHPANTDGHVFTPLVVGGQPKPEQAVGDGVEGHVAEVTHLYSDNYGHHHRIKWVNHYDNAFPVGTKLYVRPRPAVATPAEVTEENVERAAKGMWDLVPRGVEWPGLTKHIADDWRRLARAALAAQPSAVSPQIGDARAVTPTMNQPSAVGVPVRKLLRALVDAAWNEATESSHVPSTEWADRIINRVFATAPEPTHD